MKKNTKRLIKDWCTGFATCLTFLCLMGMTLVNPQMEDLAHQLRLKTLEVLQLRSQMAEKDLKLAEYRIAAKNDKIALLPGREILNI
jgi:hypothetical protein